MKLSVLYLFTLTTILFSCNSNKELNSTDGKSEMSIEQSKSVFQNNVTVKAKEGADPESLEKSFEEYNLNYKGMSSKSQNLMVFTFNDSTITSSRLIKLLKKEGDVLDAFSLRKSEFRTTSNQSSKRKTRAIK